MSKEVKPDKPITHALGDYAKFDPTGVFDDEWREMRKFLKEQWYKGYELRRLCDLEMMLKHHYITPDYYAYMRWDFRQDYKYFTKWLKGVK